MKYERIFLSGYMGSGKSTVGEILAKKLKYRFVDMDREIEEQRKMSSRDIFIKFGEHEFRNLENALLKDLANAHKIVVACGGGIILDSDNCDILKNEMTIFLDGNEEVFFERIKNDNDLPNAFLDEKNEEIRKEKFSKLYHVRLPLYEDCMKECVSVDDKTPDEIADEIVQLLENR